jgi:hypothetical protein
MSLLITGALGGLSFLLLIAAWVLLQILKLKFHVHMEAKEKSELIKNNGK